MDRTCGSEAKPCGRCVYKAYQAGRLGWVEYWQVHIKGAFYADRPGEPEYGWLKCCPECGARLLEGGETEAMKPVSKPKSGHCGTCVIWEPAPTHPKGHCPKHNAPVEESGSCGGWRQKPTEPTPCETCGGTKTITGPIFSGVGESMEWTSHEGLRCPDCAERSEG